MFVPTTTNLVSYRFMPRCFHFKHVYESLITFPLVLYSFFTIKDFYFSFCGPSAGTHAHKTCTRYDFLNRNRTLSYVRFVVPTARARACHPVPFQMLSVVCLFRVCFIFSVVSLCNMSERHQIHRTILNLMLPNWRSEMFINFGRIWLDTEFAYNYEYWCLLSNN